MKYKYIICIYTLLTIGSAISLKSQVTIGNDEPPVAGALLQLKNKSGITNADANATKGMLLPRVALTANNILTIASGTPINDNYIGAVVYNMTSIETSENERLCPGVHVWNGSMWIPMKPYKEIIKAESLAGVQPDLLDSRDGETYHTARFHSVKVFYTCTPQAPIVIDAGVWMTQNLRTTTGLTSGLPSNNVARNFYTPSNTGANAARIRENGKLYTWAAATNQKGNTINGNGNVDNPPGYEANQEGYGTPGALTEVRRQGICPTGWHLPTHTEWVTLKEALMLQPEMYSSQTAATNANVGNVFKSPLSGTGANQGTSKSSDQGGFAALLCGFSNYVTNQANAYDQSAYWWTNSSTSVGNGNSWRTGLSSSNSVFDGNAESARYNMYTIRCVKDL